VSEPFALALPPETLEAIAQRTAEIVVERLTALDGRSDWLDSKAAAEYLGISVGHLHNLKGQVPSHKVGGRRRYRRSELDAYQANGRL
jgi:excisionase family DNA binding protein